jgi:hypothetical protein
LKTKKGGTFEKRWNFLKKVEPLKKGGTFEKKVDPLKKMEPFMDP